MVAYTQYIYIMIIQTISVGPTKVDLITHYIRLGANIFPFDSSLQILCAD